MRKIEREPKDQAVGDDVCSILRTPLCGFSELITSTKGAVCKQSASSTGGKKKRPYSKPKVQVAHSFYTYITIRSLKISSKLTLCPCLEEALTLPMDFKTKLLPLSKL